MNYLLLLGVFLVGSCNAFPELLLRNIASPANASYVAVTRIASDNQICLPPAIKAEEACIRSGLWIFYSEANFKFGSSGTDSTIIYKRNPADTAYTCYKFPTWLSKNVGSFRHAGNPDDETKPALNIYVGLGYSESEVLITNSTAALPYAYNSAIVSGAARWQFFMKENFDGFSECTNDGESEIPDFTARFGVSAGDIKSIRIDCSKPFSKLNPNHVFRGY